MTLDEDRLHLDEADFRRVRSMLAPHVFALGGDDPPISDLVEKEIWDHLVHLTDDVAIRTTNWIGSDVKLAHEVSSQWLFTTPVFPAGDPYATGVSLLAVEEFDALQFNALHGFYRQALGCLRNALELLTHAAACAAKDRAAKFERWRTGQIELKFQNSRETIANSGIGRRIDGRLTGFTVFGSQHDGGWMAVLYNRLCSYAHSQAGSNNSDFWQSNGPVYRPEVYGLVVDELRETLAMCYILLRICWPAFQLPSDLSALLEAPARSQWPVVARQALDATFTADDP